MHKWQQMVKDFMEKAEQYCPPDPTVPDLSVAMLRQRLIAEELHEYWTIVDSLYAMNKEHLIEGAADAIADLLYVVLGTAVAWGIDIEPVFDEVHKSNMTKFIDGSRREDGKWMKGPSYERARIAEVLRRQMD